MLSRLEQGMNRDAHSSQARQFLRYVHKTGSVGLSEALVVHYSYQSEGIVVAQ